MRKFTALCSLLLVGLLPVAAQTKRGTITGTVLDAAGKPVPMATIVLFKQNDSLLLKTAVTNKEGVYELTGIPPGTYQVQASSVGFDKMTSQPVTISETANEIRVPAIVLVPLPKGLGEVTVTARKPFIETRIDKMIVNVDASPSNAGATALEVLEKSPGVTVDKDGTISLKGKQNVQIFLDGKPAYLSGAELVNLLNNMNASQLDQIEIMTNPPAKYDAAGNSGIINLKTKRIKQVGFNGSATAGYTQGKYARTNESLNMNYRAGKTNAFLNYSFNKNRSFQELTIHRTYLHPDKTVDAMFDQVAFMPRSNQNHNLKLGLDYFLTKKTTLGFIASGFTSSERERNYNTSYLKDHLGQVDSIVYATNLTKGRWKNASLNLNMRHVFDSSGRELTMDADYAHYNTRRDQLFTNASYFPNWVPKGQTDLLGDLPVGINIYTFKTDYTHPFRSGWKLETGLKTGYVQTKNAANFFLLETGNWLPDYSKTNHFEYKENINAAYITVNRQIKKWGIQTGLRFENTNYSGYQSGNPQRQDSSFKRSYNSLFPTVFITYQASEKHQFGINTGRRIDRPAYQDLNPFIYFIDNYTYESGNPYVRPQYSWNAELSHTYGGFLVTTLNYSRTNDYITETFEQLDYATIVRTGNIGVRQHAGVSVSAQVKVAKWWNASLYTNYNYSQYKGALYGEQIEVAAANILFNASNQFRFNKGWSAELSGWYRTRGVEGQIQVEPMGQLNAGISKQVLKGKGTLRLSARDILYTNFPTGRIDFQQTKARFENRRDTRVINLAFTWRFGKPIKAQQSNRKTGGSEEEQNRVKMDN